MRRDIVTPMATLGLGRTCCDLDEVEEFIAAKEAEFQA